MYFIYLFLKKDYNFSKHFPLYFLVNNNTLAGICVDRELNGHLLLMSPPLLHKITQYALNYRDASNENDITNSERLNENEVPEIGKNHAFKKYEQFTLNT